jgi:hypothetical protein
VDAEQVLAALLPAVHATHLLRWSFFYLFLFAVG